MSMTERRNYIDNLVEYINSHLPTRCHICGELETDVEMSESKFAWQPTCLKCEGEIEGTAHRTLIV